jgi:hypothetical protein
MKTKEQKNVENFIKMSFIICTYSSPRIIRILKLKLMSGEACSMH